MLTNNNNNKLNKKSYDYISISSSICLYLSILKLYNKIVVVHSIHGTISRKIICLVSAQNKLKRTFIRRIHS